MTGRGKPERLVLLILLVAVCTSDCGLFAEPTEVSETWTGPGRQDGQIVPIKPEENGVHPTDDENYVEHWYFDARLDNGYLVVGFLWASEMMTHEPAMELHIYKP